MQTYHSVEEDFSKRCRLHIRVSGLIMHHLGEAIHVDHDRIEATLSGGQFWSIWSIWSIETLPHRSAICNDCSNSSLSLVEGLLTCLADTTCADIISHRLSHSWPPAESALKLRNSFVHSQMARQFRVMCLSQELLTNHPAVRNA